MAKKVIIEEEVIDPIEEVTVEVSAIEAPMIEEVVSVGHPSRDFHTPIEK